MVEAVGWDMYDPRLTVKGTCSDALEIGWCAFIHTDGLIYYSGSTQTVHGCALKEAAVDDEVTLVTHGRLRMVTAQNKGVVVKGPTSGSGSPPDDGLTGKICGYSIEEYLIFVHIGEDCYGS